MRCNNKGRPCPGYCYNKLGGKVFDSEIVKQIIQIKQHEFLDIVGYRKIKHYLFRFFGTIINHKKLYRLCKQNNLLLDKKYKKKTSRKISINRLITKPHQAWEFDIKYGYIHGVNRFFYILVFIDIFSRKIVHYYVGLNCKAKNLVATFTTALRKSGITTQDNLVIRSDNGPQMTSKKFYSYLLNDVSYKVEHEFIPCGMPNKNAHIESFYSIIEREFIFKYYFKDFADVYKKFLSFIEFYNNARIHSSLSYKTPNEVLEMYQQNSLPAGSVKKLKI